MADPLLDALAADARRLRDVVAGDPDAEVPTCPGWSATRLLNHLAQVHAWVEAIVSGDPTDVDAAERPRAPRQLDELVPWFDEGLDRLLAALRADPAAERWTWVHGTRGSGGTVGWWRRRMAVETAVHRIDAELATGAEPGAIDPAVAVAGIEEALTDLLVPAGLGDLRGSLHLHRTDGDGEWLVTVGDGPPVVSHSHAKGDAAVRGPAGDLLGWLWRRFSTDRLEVFGDRALIDAWVARPGR